ncbi:hypothetical protein A2V71_01960 [Candidatus Berkelbacteria bacterium RBG_13_40_8]|uniref:Uncharacterized protein n=1 Tax=Candidatus Berkelbacteria bacterium RBG_13_40_8 TaxID=1797467 RepID=A0A1F5DPT3_9BACT|nr:MAG: hypothetical protein A2V71_01960 [Candidatus Berkelbacteria bacterium RBG_13_40_8]
MNDKVANQELRDIVNGLRLNGMPEPVALNESNPIAGLTQEQIDTLFRLVDLGEKEKPLEVEGERPTKDSEWWKVREEMRQVFRQAVKLGMIHLGTIQRNVVNYGAIPDPEQQWRYYYLPDWSYACWECGAQILVKGVGVSIHYAELRGAGGGEVVHESVPYCPTCDKEPSSHAIRTETVAESMARENVPLMRMHRE